jgi:hypothetical protein
MMLHIFAQLAFASVLLIGITIIIRTIKEGN